MGNPQLSWGAHLRGRCSGYEGHLVQGAGEHSLIHSFITTVIQGGHCGERGRDVVFALSVAAK